MATERSMELETLRVVCRSGVTTVTLYRPEKRNALNPRLIEEMTSTLDDLRDDPDTRVIVITGAGTSFSAGMDLKEFFTDLRGQPRQFERLARLSSEWRGRTLHQMPQPTIAMVNGYCFGGALSIVEGCDLAFAADNALFGLSEINFKFFPGGPVSMSLARLFRPRDALYFALTGETFDGRSAADMGVVNKSFAPDELQASVGAVAAKIASMDPEAVRVTKEAYWYSREMTWDAGINYAAAKQAELSMRQNDAWRQEGISSFLAGEFRSGLEQYPIESPARE